MALKPTDALESPSLLKPSSLFADINVAIADADLKLAALVREILATLGCNHIFTVQNGQEVLDLMRSEKIDMIVTDWNMKIMSGLDLAIFLRQSLDSPDRMIPIVMLTARNDRNDIQTARDAGVSEYLIKPFSAKSLLERVYAVVEQPRSFILCKNYVGPDRRRISSMSLPADPDESHPWVERKPALVVPKEQLKQIILDDTPRMIMPDYSLKQKIGFEIPVELITNPLTVAKSEKEIQKVQEDFLEAMLDDVEKLRKAYHLLIQSTDHAKRLVSVIKDATFSIKSRAGIFGYVRASEVANQLYNFCTRYWNKDNPYHLIILEKHIQTIAVIFEHKITGDGGKVGSDLLKDLARLINKHIKPKKA